MNSSQETINKLVDNNVASRIYEQDASLYSFSPYAVKSAENFMGWTQLASNPPYDIDKIMAFAQEIIDQGLERVILIGQGGSSQAPMTVTKIHALNGRKIRFSTLDSLSPFYLHKILGEVNIEKAMFIISSKSGGTLETTSLANIVWDYALTVLGPEHAGKHFIAITDPNTRLEKFAKESGFRKVFSGQPSIGGRFSALSVFGLVPAALTGMDLHRYLDRAKETELACATNSPENPAIQLAAFLYDHVNPQSACSFAFMSPQPGRVLGLWIEQLIAESLGKGGQGIVPQIAIYPQLLNSPYSVRPVITYQMSCCPEFKAAVDAIDDDIPHAQFSIEDPNEIGAHFVMWEYATAMLGYLMQIPPFDQPDVQAAKVNTSRALHGLLPSKATVLTEGWLLCEKSHAYQDLTVTDNTTLDEVLEYVLSRITDGDWLALDCFLPFTGARREPIERMRCSISKYLNVPTCLEIGPRYLHSTGQLQKGGDNTGVFIIISASEDDDILIPGESHSLSDIIIAQSKGDLVTLSERGRRAIHLHLVDNHADTLTKLADAFERVCIACARIKEPPFVKIEAD